MIMLASCAGNVSETKEIPTLPFDGTKESTADASAGIGTEETPGISGDPDSSGTADAESQEETETLSETPEETSTEDVRVECEALQVDCKAFCVVDDNGSIFMGRNEFVPLAPASITKTLTALIVCENCALDEKVLVSENALTEGIDIMSSGVDPSFRPGEVLTVRDLLYALMLPSTNAAGNILAEHCAGSISAFVQKMNDRVREMGLSHSHFMNPHGLDEDGHYTCAYDFAVVMLHAAKNEKLRPIMGAHDYTIPETEYAPMRGMVMGHSMVNGSYRCEGVYAGKSGSTLKAGKTLVTAVERDGKHFYVCTLGSSGGLHYSDTDNLIRWAYAKWTGAKAVLVRFAHKAEVVSAGPEGLDIRYRVANQAVSGRAVYWSLAAGSAAAVVLNDIPVNEENVLHLPLPSYGGYHLQLFVTDAYGAESVTQLDILHAGQKLPAGIFRMNGQSFYVYANGELGVGNVETGTDYYLANADGGLRTGFSNKYYAGADFSVVTGWISDNGNSYYAQPDGRIVKGGVYTVGGVAYHFDESGKLLP